MDQLPLHYVTRFLNIISSASMDIKLRLFDRIFSLILTKDLSAAVIYRYTLKNIVQFSVMVPHLTALSGREKYLFLRRLRFYLASLFEKILGDTF